MILLCISILLVGFLIYMLASHKSRRNDAIEKRVGRMVAGEQDHAVFADLHFAAARSYAISKGAKAPEQDAASATILVEGRSYFVVFSRAVGGGTSMFVRDSRSVERDIESALGPSL